MSQEHVAMFDIFITFYITFKVLKELTWISFCALWTHEMEENRKKKCRSDI